MEKVNEVNAPRPLDRLTIERVRAAFKEALLHDDQHDSHPGHVWSEYTSDPDGECFSIESVDDLLDVLLREAI